jgi:hypothetical protein
MNIHYFGDEWDPCRPLDWEDEVECEACGTVGTVADLIAHYIGGRFVFECPNPHCPAGSSFLGPFQPEDGIDLDTLPPPCGPAA